MRRLIIALALALVASAPTLAQGAPQNIEATARELGKSLRCVVCQNQSIEESSAPLAADMRNLVRERLAAGQSREEVIAYMTDRYGNFVLMQPPFQLDTLLLWFGPLLLLVAGTAGWFAYLRPTSRQVLAPAPLSDSEAEALRRLETGGKA